MKFAVRLECRRWETTVSSNSYIVVALWYPSSPFVRALWLVGAPKRLFPQCWTFIFKRWEMMVGANSYLVVASRCPSDRCGPFGRSVLCPTSCFINFRRLIIFGLWRGRPFFEEPSATYGLFEVWHGHSFVQVPSAVRSVGTRQDMVSNIVGNVADHCLSSPRYKRSRLRNEIPFALAMKDALTNRGDNDRD